MTGRLEGRTAIITGGASGMGRDTAFRFLDEGASVVIGDLNEDHGKATVEDAAERGHGESLHFVPTDVTQESDVERLVASATERFGHLDIMFNNAGVGGAFGSVANTTLEDWNQTLDVLITGVFLGIKHSARVMKAQGDGGSIINTASVAGLSGGSGPHAYSTCKAGVINLSRSTSIELAADRIRVNAICPGAINTPLVNFGNPDSMGELFDEMQPWPSHGRGDHIAGTALFLASDDSEFVTGEAIVVDGGMTAAGPGLMRKIAAEGIIDGMTGMSRGSTGQELTFNLPEA